MADPDNQTDEATTTIETTEPVHVDGAADTDDLDGDDEDGDDGDEDDSED